MMNIIDQGTTADSGAAPADAGRAAGIRVLRQEAQALERLAEELDGGFSRALDVIIATRGRVIVSGMGKSGHVARKIAATLASTGTPAFFVHPSEASHGDLGMIALDDVVIALSNSGHTAELAAVVAYAKRNAIPLIAMTGRAASPLGEQADIVLALPDMPEACPLGLAPTTSTTMMMALGDALAIALLERRGFSSDDYRQLHPGGQLGRRLIKVSDVMHAGDAMPLVAAGLPMSEAVVVMSTKRLGCVGIVDGGGALIGIITDGDLRRHMAEGLMSRTAGEIMTPRPRTIRANALVAEAIGAMNKAAITTLFVVEGMQPIGLLHIHDCLRAGGA